MKLRPILSTALLASCVSIANANICKSEPGSITCGKGEVNSLTGNGMVTINGTTILGDTAVNGMLNATDGSFNKLNVNGAALLVQCTVNETAQVKGTLTASSCKFENTLRIYSNMTRFINSKVNYNLIINHTDNKEQVVYLDNHSEVNGDITFEDKNGKVIVRGGSKVTGNIYGGRLIRNYISDGCISRTASPVITRSK
tara:strand:- start:59 stop:655 length:597 start_codon:yes stop_codon:yes gene_type:complete